jgi:DNA invertase Pin-like site-specific DNA recombinase
MQAAEGMSLDAQRSAIESYCAMMGIKLVKLCQDVMSGGKDVRPGLADALRTLQGSADVLIVLKFDRLSRSIKHFCELYETYFKDGTKELVAIRESIRLDSSLGRALVGILLVFAQMEREATGERTKEAISYIKRSGYHVGKVPYGKRTIAAPDHPMRKILVDDEEEQRVIAQIKEWANEGVGISEMAVRLNAKGVPPPQGKEWTKSLLYNLRLRLSFISPKPHNARPYSDSEVRERILELRAKGHTLRQTASILNEQGWIPLKGRCFTERNIHGLLRTSDATKVLTPKRYLQMMLTKMERAHDAESPDEPFAPPSLAELARFLTEAGYKTPRGKEKWWPAQVQQVMEGRFEGYYGAKSGLADGGMKGSVVGPWGCS